MTVWNIPLYKVFWDEEDLEATAKVIKRGTFWAIGPEIEEFERAIAEYFGRKYAVAFNSGTSALHAIMLGCEIGHGDKVITPSFTFIATANAPLFAGATPSFADIEPESFGLDAEKVSRVLDDKVKAVMPIHYGGMPCRDIELLRELTEQRDILLIEDAAESIGSEKGGVKIGNFGDAAMFSLCGNKVITTGEGGIVVTDSGALYERLKLVRSHGRPERKSYFLTAETPDYIKLGYNWRMPSMIAALGLTQLKKLEKVISMRQERALYYSINLKKIEWMKVPDPLEESKCAHQMYTIRVSLGKKVRDALQEFLAKRGITTKVYFEPVHLTHFYREKLGHKEGELPMTERISKEVLTLPLYPTMTKEEMDYVINNITEFARNVNAQKS
ncbi:MAG: DegT/DnrJ/EryC1/StrS family aminotransferase [Candidatus Bathyarchaeota archaeon]|nr:DegT/DnrJ/EryC1/StrS family aminotransferase [Candidatus Bathyarchaeota archaeon]